MNSTPPWCIVLQHGGVFMDSYDVFLDGVIVGKAEIATEGLYYRFRCRCTLPGQGMYRLTARTADHQIDLGICVPQGSIHTVDKLVPKKHFKDMDIKLFVSVKEDSENVKCVCVDPDKPFTHISQLLNAKLRIVNQVYEIVVK